MRKLLGFSKNDVEACFDSFGWLSDRCAVLWRKIKCDFFPFRGSVSVSGRMLSFGRGGFFSRVISFGRSVVFSELSFLEMSFLLKRALLVCKGVIFFRRRCR